MAHAQIFQYAWQLKKNGYADGTIERNINALKRLSQICNIDDPEQVKGALARLNWKTNTKRITTECFTRYYEHIGITWKPPKYSREETTYFIPTEQEIDALITASRIKQATLLQLIKETGARIGEIQKLKWTDLDQERRTVSITAEKGSNNRILPISNKLIAMLNQMPKKNDKVFSAKYKTYRTSLEQLRKSLADRLGNPRINRIHFHTLRHWKGTIEYHKTKDLIHVMQILGHKQIKSTMIYINLENAIFHTETDQFTCKVANTIQQATELIENGFEYVTEIEGTKLFRKRK